MKLKTMVWQRFMRLQYLATYHHVDGESKAPFRNCSALRRGDATVQWSIKGLTLCLIKWQTT